MPRAPLRLVLLAVLIVGLALAAFRVMRPAPGEAADDRVVAGEAREGSVTVALGEAVSDVAVREARVPGRPLVLIDAGHGGRDSGAPGALGLKEKDVTLAFARQLADLLSSNGQVRVALTRERDDYPTLDQRAALARRLGAGLFVSIHMDSASSSGASGVTVYSLSDVASSAEAARFARTENRGLAASVTSEKDATLRGLLTDVARRDQMEASADAASRIVRRASGRVPLRPRPHQFADFHVLRQSDAPAVLVEAGYLSNPLDAARLSSDAGRAPLVEALAQAIEAYLLKSAA